MKPKMNMSEALDMDRRADADGEITVLCGLHTHANCWKPLDTVGHLVHVGLHEAEPRKVLHPTCRIPSCPQA